MDTVHIFYNGKYRFYNDDNACKNSANSLGVTVYELNRRTWDWDDSVETNWERKYSVNSSRKIIIVQKRLTD